MRLSLASPLFLLLSIYPTTESFSPSSSSSFPKVALSLEATAQQTEFEVATEEKDDVEIRRETWAQKCGYVFPDHVTPLSAQEINERMDAQLQKMRMKDKMSTYLDKEVREILQELLLSLLFFLDIRMMMAHMYLSIVSIFLSATCLFHL